MQNIQSKELDTKNDTNKIKSYIEPVEENRYILSEREYNIYKWHILNFKEKDYKFNYCIRIIRIFLNSFLNALTLGYIKRECYCPYCSNKVNKLSYSDSPIFSFGCGNCRIKLYKD